MTSLQAWIVFLVLTVLHVIANWKAVTCLTLNTLNQNRAAVAVDWYIYDVTERDEQLAMSSAGSTDSRASTPVCEPYFEEDLRPSAIVTSEPLWPSAWWNPSNGAVIVSEGTLLSLLRYLPFTSSQVGVKLEVCEHIICFAVATTITLMMCY